jgi:type IV secretory pathway VirJ component
MSTGKLLCAWAIALPLLFDTPAYGDDLKPKDDVGDLSLVEVPAAPSQDDALCVIVSGDGGWAALDKGIAAYMSQKGVPVVGLNSLKYFWEPRTPDESSQALARILRHYFALWKKDKAILVGYSFGADVIPFMVSRLPADLRGKVELVAMLGASPSATFEFHLSDWLPVAPAKSKYPTKEEVEKLKGIKVLCIYGEEDTECVCNTIDPAAAKAIKLPGSHHFDRDYDALAALILKERPAGGG